MSSATQPMTDPWPRHRDHPVVDEQSAAVLEDALHSLTMLGSPGHEGDAGAGLHVTASLLAQAQAALADAGDHDCSWSEIAERLGLTAAPPGAASPPSPQRGWCPSRTEPDTANQLKRPAAAPTDLTLLDQGVTIASTTT